MAYDLQGTEAYIRQAAKRRGIDPDVAVRVARSEGLAPGVYQSNLSRGGQREPSFGPFQLLVGGDGTNYPAGMGNDFKARTGLDPSDPSTVNAQIDFALDHASKNGWGAWYGAAKAGVGNRDGIGSGGAAGAVTQMGNGGRAPGADDALVSAYADRGPTGVKVEGPSTQAAGPEASSAVAVPKLQSTDLEDALIARQMAGSKDIDNLWDLAGSLAQVWAASSAKKDKETKNETALAQAMKSAGLDPDVAALAQLGGDRESLVSAVALQNQRKTQTQERAWKEEDRTYERGRDAKSDARADRTLEIQERVANQKAEGYTTLTSDEVKAAGLPPGVYQRSGTGKIDPIGGNSGKAWQRLDDGTLYSPTTGETRSVGGTGGKGRLFEGKGVEGQALNGLVERGILTEEQALNMGAGKTITDPSTGAVMFMTPQGIFTKPTQGGQTQTVAPFGSSSLAAGLAAPPASGGQPQPAPAAAAPLPGQPAAPPAGAALAGGTMPSAPSNANPGLIPVTPGKDPAGKPTEQMVRDGKLYSVMAPELDIIDKTYGALGDTRNQVAGQLPAALGRIVGSDDFQRATGAVNTIAQQYLYSVSGASAPAEEVNKLADSVTPRVGDSEPAIRDKLARLKQMTDAVRVGIGPGAPPPRAETGGTDYKGRYGLE